MIVIEKPRELLNQFVGGTASHQQLISRARDYKSDS